MNITFLSTCLVIMSILGFNSCQSTQNLNNLTMNQENNNNPYFSLNDSTRLSVDDEKWKQVLTPEEYYIARQKGTERPWTSPFETSKEIGTYHCKACGNALFESDTKFESGCGWPSFYKPISKTSMIYTPDYSHGMERTEVSCGRCKAHLGHVFEDGPPPTGLRYCINGVILHFNKKS